MVLYANRGVHGQTVEALARKVLSGEFAQGQILDLTALQRELDVSLTALRESLKVLSAKGMVDARQKRGTFIRPRSDWNLLDADVLRWQSSVDSGTGLLASLDEVRYIFEPAAAQFAAERRTDDDLRTLEAALSAMAEGSGSPGGEDQFDLAFHRALLVAAHNELLARMEVIVESAMAERSKFESRSARCADHVLSHRAVLEAVRRRDPAAAAAAMCHVLDHAKSAAGRGGDPSPADSIPNTA
ncbi:FadR/GntR family transcriptional regulator [Streptomyces sp. NPDC020800]|uniref:FadR/GntR family transcriptional regulator n=1 Tax=Streptomyces sp. NPDC020800 TaxID=3365092 RepID=UPI0037A483C7